MKAVIFLNPDGVSQQKLDEIRERLNKENITSEMYKDNTDLSEFDFAVAFGGDGTILHAAKMLAPYNKGVLGINGGHLGYTAGLEVDELDLLSGLHSVHYKIDKRMMFEITVNSDESKYYCINDAVISKGALSKIIDISVMAGGNAIIHTCSDGVIVSTPTGSTAYSLSAGGPILDPSINSILITPICPHSFFSRPVVLSEDEIIKVRVNNRGGAEAYLTSDGETSIKISENDVITIKKAECITANLIRIKDESFMNILHNKLFERSDLS